MSNVLARAADATACQMLNDIGSAGTRLAVWTMWTPKAALVPLTVGALSYMANNLLCNESDGPPDDREDRLDGCVKGQIDKSYFIQYWQPQSEQWSNSTSGYIEILEVNYVLQFNGLWGHNLTAVRANGTIGRVNVCHYPDEATALANGKYRLDVPADECEKDNDPEDPGQPKPELPDYQFEDPETNCNYTLKLEGFVQQHKDGPAQPVWNIRSANDGRAEGGRMGGCNLSPTIYIGGSGGGDDGPNGPPQIPVPPNPPGDDPDGVPWWLPPLLTATTTALLNQIAEGIKDLNRPSFNEGSFTLTAPCDVDENGDPQSRTWEFLEGSFEERVNAHQVALMEMLQQHLNWKTPTCTSEKPALEGEWVTTRWESTEVMPHSGHRLRKQFRYRSKSSLDLAQRSAYWEYFQWQSGDVVVRHEGAWWGNPQVWAASEEEGKRVIRFAAGEAGLDPDQVGEWTISSSRSPRYGMSGTMKIQLYKGFPWVSSRGGSSYPNTLAKAHDP